MNLRKLNPFNSLFGRIFLWFWLSTLVMLSSGFFLAQQLSSQVEVSAPSASELGSAQAAVQRLDTLLTRGLNMRQSLRRVSERGRILAISYHLSSQRIELGFPPPMLRNPKLITSMLSADSPVHILTRNSEFIGPIRLRTAKGDHAIFIGKLLPRNERNEDDTAAIAGITIAVLLSALFCLLLVWNLTKPIQSLRKASKAFAEGNLATRIDGFQHRQDEIGQLANDFNEMAERLQRAIDSQKQLMGNVSHELRSPLTRMQLALALLGDSMHDKSAQVDTNLQRIEKEIQQMNGLIEQVLVLAKINAGHKASSLQTVSVADALQGVLDDAQFEAGSVNKTLEIGDIAAVSLHISPTLFSSAVDNVLRNAIRFSNKVVRVSITTDANWVAICVDDDGLGLASKEASEAAIQAKIDDLFEPFYRAHNQVPELISGAGLGLSIAKAAVHAQGGKIIARPSVLGGLAVSLYFPLVLS